MNILHVGKYFAPFHGGLENYLRDLMMALGRRGIASAALVHRHDGSPVTRDETITIDGMKFRVVRAGTLAKLFFTPISPSFPRQMRRLIRELAPDVLHLHMPNPSVFWALVLPSARRLPWIVHWHADVVTATHGSAMRLLYVVYQPLERAVLRRAGAIVTTSARYRDSSVPLQTWLAKCRVVPLGMDASRLCNGATPRRTAEERPPVLRVLAVGRLTYYKGLRYLVEATARVELIRLDLVGAGDQEPDLHALVSRLDLQDRVTFHGALGDPELAGLIAQCDCLCLPSIERTEAFGMVLLEAMCFGKATVVSDVPGSGMGWIVDHGITGLTVEPANAEALADAFRQLARDRETLRTMGARGREKFDRQFDINRAVEGIIETYQAVLALNRGAGQQGNP